MPRPRFPLRSKIALFAAGLIVLAVGALALVTVYRPWRQKIAAQRHLALQVVRPVATSIVRRTKDTVRWDAHQIGELVNNSATTAPGLDLAYALLYDEHGVLLPDVSVANVETLGRLAPRLQALYRRDRPRCLQVLAGGAGGLDRVTVTLKVPDGDAPLGRMVLGFSTATIDAEARGALLGELLVLGATLLLGVLGAVLIGGRIARPLDELAAAMGKARLGDFDQELTAPARARDEIGDLARAFNEMIGGLRQRERLRGTLGRYVSGEVAERILAERDDLSLRGEERRVTVLFLDVRGFTSLAEKLSPPEVMELLNDYFAVVIEAVQRRGGTVNKFIGDAALCLWGAPRPAEQPELSAVRAALEIQIGARALGEQRAQRGLAVVGLGVGINTGVAVAGNLGAAARMEYTVIGDAVNVAARLESHAQAGEVLVSEAVYLAVAASVLAEPREPVKLKGKSQPVPLWRVLALSGAKTEAA